MALDPLEWGVIAVMGIAIFIWGPEKVPEIAKTLGNARRDLEATTKQLQGMSKELSSSVGQGNLDGMLNSLIPGISGNPTPEQVAQATRSGAAIPGEPTTQAPNIVAPPMSTGSGPQLATMAATSGDRLLVELARKLGISTQGKTRDDIQSEIVARASQTPAEPVPPTEAAPANVAEPVPAEQPKTEAEPQPVTS